MMSYYDPLHYVLMFIHSEPGWQYNTLKLNRPNQKQDYVSLMQFYSYQLQDRPGFLISSIIKIFNISKF